LGDPAAAVCYPIDCTSEVIRDQERAVLHHLHVDRPSDVFIVLEEAGEKGLHRLHRAVLVQLRDNDVAADLLRPVPGAVTRDEDGVTVFWREHAAGVETHAERGRVWT